MPKSYSSVRQERDAALQQAKELSTDLDEAIEMLADRANVIQTMAEDADTMRDTIRQLRQDLLAARAERDAYARVCASLRGLAVAMLTWRAQDGFLVPPYVRQALEDHQTSFGL